MTDQRAQQRTQEQVNKAALATCDTFRGVVDAGQYKNYILVMLFLKYISDVWKEHDDTGGCLEHERFILPKGASFYDLHEKRIEANIGELINIALGKIGDSNLTKLEGVFRNIDFNSASNLGGVKDRNRHLKKMLEDFAKPELDLSPSQVSEDIIGKCYIYLISCFASDARKTVRGFYTPAAISDLLAKLAAPKPGDTICDPACGSGSLLIRAAEQAGSDDIQIYGQEVHGAIWVLARMNMFLHSNDTARIEWCNTLNSPALIKDNQLMKFDVVVSIPSFGLNKWGAEEAATDKYKRYWRGIPPKSKGDYAFITHMVEIAKRQSGRVAVVVPHSVLFRDGTEGEIRQSLIKENLLDAVIGLPARVLISTGIPVAILVFDRSREQGGENAARKDVLFIDASKEFSQGRAQNVMDEKHIAKVLETYVNRAEVDKYSHQASLEEITENDFKLNIPRYVDTFRPKEEVSVDVLKKKIFDIETELTEVRERIKELY